MSCEKSKTLQDKLDFDQLEESLVASGTSNNLNQTLGKTKTRDRISFGIDDSDISEDESSDSPSVLKIIAKNHKSISVGKNYNFLIRFLISDQDNDIDTIYTYNRKLSR